MTNQVPAIDVGDMLDVGLARARTPGLRPGPTSPSNQPRQLTAQHSTGMPIVRSGAVKRVSVVRVALFCMTRAALGTVTPRGRPPTSRARNADSGRAALAEGCFLGTAGLVLRRQTCPRVRARRTADSRHNLRRDGAAARPVLVRAGHAVGDVDPLRRDAERGEGVTLWVRFLFIAGDAGASEFEHRHRRGCRLASRHRDCSPDQSYGTRCPGRPRDWPLVKDGVGRAFPFRDTGSVALALAGPPR